MNTTTSKDGTTIAFDRLGQGPLVVLVGGALQHRALDRVIGQRAPVLAQHFTLVHYDRRGRGDSGDTPPYAVAREIEDLEAVIASVGGAAHVLGMSSGGALALAASGRLGTRVKTLALYEVPFNDDPAARAAWQPFVVELRSLLTTDRRDEALALFMRHFGTPSEQLEAMRQSPLWPTLLSVAPTLAYDIAVLGSDNAIPVGQIAGVAVPTLVLDGGASFAFIHATARALAQVLPHAQHRTLAAQTHAVQAEALAEILADFFVE